MGITWGEGLTLIVSSQKTEAGGQKAQKISLVWQLLRGMLCVRSRSPNPWSQESSVEGGPECLRQKLLAATVPVPVQGERVILICPSLKRLTAENHGLCSPQVEGKSLWKELVPLPHSWAALSCPYCAAYPRLGLCTEMCLPLKTLPSAPGAQGGVVSLSEGSWSYWGVQLHLEFLPSGFRSRYLEYNTSLIP